MYDLTLALNTGHISLVARLDVTCITSVPRYFASLLFLNVAFHFPVCRENLPGLSAKGTVYGSHVSLVE